VRADVTKVLGLRSEIRRAGWFILENASGVKAVPEHQALARRLSAPMIEVWRAPK
jgi:hypothetical protein